MKASTYQRKHTGAMPDAVLNTLMRYHKCDLHNGPGSGACLADMLRTDLIMETLLPMVAGVWNEGANAGRQMAQPFVYGAPHPEPITNPYERE